MYVKLENENRFLKNTMNNSLINTDISGLKEYKNKKEMANKVKMFILLIIIFKI